MNQSHHMFAFYSSQPLVCQSHDFFIDDKALVCRINRIVRLKPGEQCVVFDGAIMQRFSLVSYESDRVLCRPIESHAIKPLEPEIHWFIPLLEHDAMERVAYYLAACGITSWTPIIAEKSHRNYLNPKELDRLKRITIAACEQAKQFSLPVINAARMFSEIPQILTSFSSTESIFFDPDGISSYAVINKFREKKVSSIVCMIGPEGDLSAVEKKVLEQLGFTFCSLVPTILRAEDACSLASGMLRSLV